MTHHKTDFCQKTFLTKIFPLDLKNPRKKALKMQSHDQKLQLYNLNLYIKFKEEFFIFWDFLNILKFGTWIKFDLSETIFNVDWPWMTSKPINF